MNELIKSNYKLITKYTAIIFIILFVIITIVTGYFQNQMDAVEKTHIIDQERVALESQQAAIYNKLSKISGDLLYLADDLYLNDYGNNDYTQVSLNWQAFSNRKEIYDQIRFIDINGDEIIRVNYENTEALLAGENERQNKKDRYYFTKTIELGKNEIYISPLDLNMENGLVEEPQKPMLRLATPYYDRSGILKGMVIINYSGADMINRIDSIAELSRGSVSLLNQESYWLYSQKEFDKTWAFMYEDRENDNFAYFYPDVWEKIREDREDIFINEQGVFIYSKVLEDQTFYSDNKEYSFTLSDSDWILVSMIEPGTESLVFDAGLLSLVIRCLQKYSFIYVVAFFITLLTALLMVINKNEKERIKYFSEYDAMTGIYNRRTGFEKINQILDKQLSHSWESSLCFLDINGLKEVNDRLGHERGDELIKSIVEVIKKNIRDTDFVSRLGGDEFLIVFEGTDLLEAEEIWKRIVEGYNQINETENRPYLISVSHGIEQIRYNSEKYIDAIVNRADEKMYEEKRRIKKDIKIIRSEK